MFEIGRRNVRSVAMAAAVLASLLAFTVPARALVTQASGSCGGGVSVLGRSYALDYPNARASYAGRTLESDHSCESVYIASATECTDGSQYTFFENGWYSYNHGIFNWYCGILGDKVSSIHQGCNASCGSVFTTYIDAP